MINKILIKYKITIDFICFKIIIFLINCGQKVLELKPNEAEFNFGTEPKDASLQDLFSSQVKPSRVGEHCFKVK